MQILQQLREILGQELRHEPDIEAYLRDHYPPSYREVMDAEQEMVRSYHTRTAFTDAEENLIGLNLYQSELTDDQVDALLKLDLPHLRSLNLARNPLSRFTLSARMPALQVVAINHNEKLQRLRCEDGLGQLWRLDASFCALSQFRIPATYTGLRDLRLDGNTPLGEVRFDGPCPRLEILMLRGGALKAFRLPAGFDSLVHLYLNQNQIETLELEGELGELRTLQLRGNRLENLPFSLIQYKNLEGLYVGDNPLSAIPKGIITKKDDQSSLSEVLSYLREAVKGESPNERVKLIIVGNGRVGKTSLYRRLKGLPYREKEEYTHGVQLGSLDKSHLSGVKTQKLELNVWDFGGQEIFYATHQFFLNDNALYLLAWTSESNVEEARKQAAAAFPDEKWRSREYWLENIRLNAPRSPVLMVQTQIDKRRLPINEAEYFEAPYHAECLSFSAAHDTGLMELRSAIERKLNDEVDFLGQPIANSYLKAVQQIGQKRDEMKASRTKPILDWPDFHRICTAVGLEAGIENEKNLCRYLHNAGVVVYFGEDARFPHLQEAIYIDPDWLTQEVYRLINPALDQTSPKGRITPGYLDQVFPDYTPVQKQQFLELLRGFDLIFQERNKPDRHIAPQYLPEQLPEEAQVQVDRDKRTLQKAFAFRFSAYMPDNVMVNFLCKYGPYSDELFWRNGISFFSEQGGKCVVEFEPAGKCFQVWSEARPDAGRLQQEICQAFVELSRNAKAEVSLDGTYFVSWQALKEAVMIGNANVQAFDAARKSQIFPVAAFTHLLDTPKHPEDILLQKNTEPMNPALALIGKGKLKEALDLLLTALPDEKSTIILLQSRLNGIDTEENKGIISPESARLERNKISHAAISLTQQLPAQETQAPDTSTPAAPISPVPAIPDRPIYFSHAWADDEGAGSLVNMLYEELEKSGFQVLRDKEGIPFGGSIEKFMNELGQAPLILVFSSDKYAQSPNCMFELYEIARHAKWERAAFQARVLPVLVKFVNFTEPDVLDIYFAHWEKQEKKWDDFIKGRSGQATEEQFKRFQRIKEINANFGRLADWLADLNGSSRPILSADNFELVKQTIIQRLQNPR